MLLLGNYLNEEGRQATGFKLDSLQRMQLMKDERNMTFLHQVERIVRRGFPEIEQFLTEFATCKAGCYS